MNNKYKITYLPLFYKDLSGILDYIKNKLKNKIAANNLIDEIENSIIKRANSSAQYEEYVSSKKRKRIYYRIYVKNYIIFYTIKNDEMEIRRILYSKRNFDKFV